MGDLKSQKPGDEPSDVANASATSNTALSDNASSDRASSDRASSDRESSDLASTKSHASESRAEPPDLLDTISMGRRELVVTGAVGAALVASAAMGAGFLWPRRHREWFSVFTCMVDSVPVGDVKEVLSPRGERIYLLRLKDTRSPEHILAIGTTCTHLGCRVFFRPENAKAKRFHCPCHQGFFDQSGNPTAGPPERPLPRYEVEVRGNLLFLKYPQV